MSSALPAIVPLPITHPKYPRLLREIADPPRILYVRGWGTPVDLTHTIAIVGARRMTGYGQTVTRSLVRKFVSAGFTVVSGLAVGIDTVAHSAAIESGGKTVAVLGCGLDIIHPARNALLYRAIVNGGGAVVSEIPQGRTGKTKFVTRNRIISGLSLGVVVIEGDETSGALITARYAAEQGRDVFAVPGPVTSVMSRGPAILLKNGAKLVESADDILEEYK